MISTQKKSTQTLIKNTLKLLTDPQMSLSDVLTMELIKSLCVQKDPALMEAFKVRLEEALKQAPERDEESHQACQEVCDEDIRHINAKIDNLLSFMAYTEPPNKSIIMIPTLINEKFELISYTVEKLTLSANTLSSPYQCYGLTASIECQAPARLLFMGTTFPTADGFAKALLADTAPGGGVGYSLYNSGKKILEAWVNTQFSSTHKPVHCCGQSLGGALSMQAYIHQPHKISFTAINPPFLTEAERRVFNTSSLEDKNVITNNQIYSHVLDPIASIGHWFPNNATVYIHGSKTDFSGNWVHRLFKAHAALLDTQSFCKYTGINYLRMLQCDTSRYVKHKLLKPVRATVYAAVQTSTVLYSTYQTFFQPEDSQPLREIKGAAAAEDEDATLTI